MRKYLFSFGIVLFLLTLSLNTAFATGVLTVTQKRFLVVPNDTYYSGEIFAEVSNTGDKAIQFSRGLFELYDAKGNVIGTLDLDGYCNPAVLEPGEISFIQASIPVEAATEEGYIADYSLTISGQDNITRTVERFLTTTTLEMEQDPSSEDAFRVNYNITNSTDEYVFGWYNNFEIKDANGDLLYINGWYNLGFGLNPNSTMKLFNTFVSSFVNNCSYFDADHVPASAECIVFRYIK